MAIATGCAQAPVEADKPEEPPVVDQPQKPAEETKVKKIDDYVTIEENIFKTYEAQIEFNEEFQFGFRYDKIVLNFDSVDARNFNNKMNDIFENCAKNIKLDKNGEVRRANFFDEKCYLSEQVLSIVTRYQEYLFESDVLPASYQVYNFDIKTGVLLSNDELLKLLHTTYDKLSFEENNKINRVTSNSELFVVDEHLYTLQTRDRKNYTGITYRELIKVKND